MKTETMNVPLSAFAKADLTLEEKVKLFNDWEEDRGSDGEYIYDLDDDNDAISWLDMYGAKYLYECRQIGRYWVGGWQFHYKDANTDEKATAWCFNEESTKDLFTENNFFFDVERRYEILKDDYSGNIDGLVMHMSKIYDNLINFDRYATAIGDLKHYYKWVARSNDGFEDATTKRFDDERDCYEDMRDAVLEKMTWNTDYDDFGHEYDEENVVTHYDVEFNPKFITHKSYSGYYVYLLVPFEISDDELNKKFKEFFDNEVM